MGWIGAISGSSLAGSTDRWIRCRPCCWLAGSLTRNLDLNFFGLEEIWGILEETYIEDTEAAVEFDNRGRRVDINCPDVLLHPKRL